MEKMTRQELRRRSDLVLRAGYCEFANLLRDEAPFAYNCGLYGWNWHAFELKSDDKTLIVCTGYRNLEGQKVDGLAGFERKAKEIWASDKTYEQKKAEQKKWLKKFVDFVYFKVDSEKKRNYSLKLENLTNYFRDKETVARLGEVVQPCFVEV